MLNLVSPEYSLAEFCNQMLGKDFLMVMESASAEISYARRNYKEIEGDYEFREGSKEWLYCENLQRLIKLLMNGKVSPDSPPEFLSTIRPLIMDLLQRWEIGDLRRVFENLPDDRTGTLLELADPLIVIISREEVQNEDINPALNIFEKLIESPKTARDFFERVEIAFQGYDQHTHELFEIKEVRDYVYQLDKKFPFWLFFLSKQLPGLHCLLLCFLPPFLTEDARRSIFPQRIGQLLDNRWFPAMNHMCEYVGLSDKEIRDLTDRVVSYITV